MSFPHVPWEPTYTPPPIDGDLLQTITGITEHAVQDMTAAATNIGGQIAGQVAGPVVQQEVQGVEAVITAAEQAAGAVLTSATGPEGAGPIHTVGPITPVGGGTIAEVIKASAQGALAAALPAIQDRIAHAAEQAIAKELAQLAGGMSVDGEAPVATIPKADLKKMDAWERAARTFLIGIFVTVLGALAQVIGSLSTTGHINFFSQDGWMAVGTLAVGAVVSGVSSYVLRYLKEPAGAAIDSSTKPPT